ncbi:MAG: nucleotidyltransferase domain-containing protein [Clostridiales bacterium]|nr:nucleotidyltransferase domain-containing protein [Clostridiales bacterium]
MPVGKAVIFVCTRSELSTILSELAKSYRRTYGSNLQKVILYGSYARGDYREDSDIDVAAIVKGPRRELQDELKKVWDVSHDLGLEYGTIVSPTVIPYDEFEAMKDDLPYYKNIETEGVVVGG